MSSIFDWSLQAANNANADDNINWAEGQPPSTVNNSARAMMQRIAEYITDLGGSAKAEGTPNMLTLFAKSPYKKYVDNIRISLHAVSANTGAATLNVNAVGAKPIYCVGSSGVAAIADNAGGWFLLNPTHTQAVSPGFMQIMTSPIAPAGYLYCNGQAVSRTTYAALYAVIGNRWGAGDGWSTFNLPDMRGVFPRGWDDGRGVDPGRVFASWQENANRWHGHSFSGQTGGGGGHDHNLGSRECSYGPSVMISRAGGNWSGMSPNRTSWVGDHSHSFCGATSGDGANEARPTNLTFYFVIKT